MKRKKSKDPDMKKTVLVADDSPTIRKIVQLCLKEQQIEIVSAGSGAEALERLRKSPPDLVLADTVMPAPDGYQLCERIKGGEFGAPVPVILLADVFEPVDGVRLSTSGADGQITKPFDARTLQLMVADQLGIDPPASLPQPAPESLVSPAVRRALQAVSPMSGSAMSDQDLDAVARRVVKMLSDDVVREVVWEVVPEMSEVLIRERLQNQNR